ncbi:phytanoyl-CoA dioxygenase family protein [Hamadaea flava]|uniref:Phytanoyl-CoA dioxygenase family protein n=1 Tax=Hamadaea flava TaxID=1742688 RepID=A0ABV8M214_9ACTN|nr:phytanoyl-CoA dioxygenase family protein [Hamadaea flava]
MRGSALDSDLVALREDGYVVLQGLLGDAELAAARNHADDLLSGIGWSDNDFDGRRTRRVYSLLSRVGAFDSLLLHPRVRNLVTASLGEVYQFGMLFLSAVDPGQGTQPLHFDAGVYPLPRDVEAETNVIWALDDFTADNGATLIAPGSHRWAADRRPKPSELVPAVMPAGSALVYSGRLWHAAGHNTSETTRRALICEHVLPWLRPADNHILGTGLDGLRRLTPGLRRLAGVALASDYLGFVAGQDPERWLHHADDRTHSKSSPT